MPYGPANAYRTGGINWQTLQQAGRQMGGRYVTGHGGGLYFVGPNGVVKVMEDTQPAPPSSAGVGHNQQLMEQMFGGNSTMAGGDPHFEK